MAAVESSQQMLSTFPHEKMLQNSTPSEFVDLSMKMSVRPPKVEIQCQDRRNSIPLLDVAKQTVYARKLASTGRIGELSPSQDVRCSFDFPSVLAPVDTRLSTMTLSQSHSKSVGSGHMRALSLDSGSFLGENQLEVSDSGSSSPSSESVIESDIDKKRRRKRSPRAQRERRENRRTVYLEPIPEGTTEADIHEILNVFGELQNVELVGDYACFARFASYTQSSKALEVGVIGKIVITSKREQLAYVRAELERLKNEHTVLLTQLGANHQPIQQDLPTAGGRRRMSVTQKMSSGNATSHRRVHSAADSSMNWRMCEVSPKSFRNQSFQHTSPKSTSSGHGHRRAMSELPRQSGAPRLNLLQRKSVSCTRVSKGPDGTRGFARTSLSS